ncbi:hypothetical protein [Spartinivicinus poritis]|uniref:DUF2628 domain-containing protein n=1 Tax=Spartinivicinus poritis TaxID=2994640 RepID=A0ABT5UKP1_9GAMM|nr:hypothetical protein [Spartinivicinus sp. A2-2]MDE1465943.1 hypothetical protein [Spartinivicinus sp. A2-2]
MADNQYLLKSDQGKIVKAYDGVSYTVFFFGPLPMLFFRRDFPGIILLLISVLTVIGFCVIVGLIRGYYPHPLDHFVGFCLVLAWSFFYNGWHRKRLLNEGYQVIEKQDISRRVLVL